MLEKRLCVHFRELGVSLGWGTGIGRVFQQRSKGQEASGDLITAVSPHGHPTALGYLSPTQRLLTRTLWLPDPTRGRASTVVKRPLCPQGSSSYQQYVLADNCTDISGFTNIFAVVLWKPTLKDRMWMLLTGRLLQNTVSSGLSWLLSRQAWVWFCDGAQDWGLI